MQVNINRAIKSIGNVTFYQPLYEAIVNSFEANAKTIKIDFTVKDGYILGYSVEDDGGGFKKDDIASYLELWSEHKIDKGALGSGRIMCLKVFDNIITESQTVDGIDKRLQPELAHFVEIDFNREFKANTIDDINPTKKKSDKSYTVTNFKNINEEFVSSNGKERFNLDTIKEDIFIKLLPMFINFHKEEKEFSIVIDSQKWLDKSNLEKAFKAQKFEEISFKIEKDLSIYDKENGDIENKEEFIFNLFYRIIEDDKNQLEQFYGASNRHIKDFPKGIRLEKLEKGHSGIFCLTSDYLDKRVKDSRNDFKIGFNQSNPTKENPVTFPEINKNLLEKLNIIIKQKFPNIEQEFTDKKEKVVEKFPHLSRYVKKIDNLTMSESDMLALAEKDFLKETKEVRQEVENFTKQIQIGKKFDEKAYEEITRHFTQVGREQLADYIGYRQTIIDMLLEIYDETSKDKYKFDEKDIHDLFMPMSETSNTLFTYANNVWIFDDKFMSYNYAASDKTIAKIVFDVIGDSSEVPKHHKGQEPDLVMLYSHPENEYKDILLIEFKRLNNVLSEKKKAITQLQDYPMYIRKNIDKVRSVFSYTIIDIDEPFREWLTDSQDFDEHAFGDEDDNISAYYRYFEKVKSHVNVVSFSQILEDANKRNKVFLDILIQNFKMNNEQ